MSVRLPREFARVDIIGKERPCDIWIHKENGRFCVVPHDDPEGGTYHDRLADARQFAEELQIVDTHRAIVFTGFFRDRFPEFELTDIRRIAGRWCDRKGTPYRDHYVFLRPDETLLGSLEDMRAEYVRAKQLMERLRQSAIYLANEAQKADWTE